eukprot:gb/GFBE01038648.1/.p1 GENE.gb/GFBE01038648.1/~~gb/GFBE01038648.1/.p1  ORF type:complete len:615 (+),score=120.31 gb/GFBE01038648.1/:1-1845(+)
MLDSIASQSKSGRAGNAWSELSTVPAYPADPAEEEPMFAMVEKLVRAAGVSARQHNLKNAASALRRAYGVASTKADAGLLAGRVARAAVAVQYCTLLSRFDRHTMALKEALAAAREAEEVWSILMQAAVARDHAHKRGEALVPDKCPFGLLLREPPAWMERAIVVLVQAKHCVAIELEFSISEPDAAHQHPEEIETVRDHLVPSLHREAAEIATQLLPKDHPVRLHSERAQAQSMVRRHDPPPALMRGWTRPDSAESREPEEDGQWEGMLDDIEQSLRRRPIPPALTTPTAAPAAIEAGWVSPADDAMDTYGAPSPSEPGGPGGSRPTSAASRASRPINSRPPSAHLSRPTSAARIHQLEDQALIRPVDVQWQPPPEDMQDGDDLRYADIPFPQALGMDPEALDEGHIRRQSSGGSGNSKRTDTRSNSKSKRGQKSGEEEGSKNIFAEWVHGNYPKGRQGKVFTRSKSEAGVQELKKEMQRESQKLKLEELPLLSPEIIYDNKVLYSHYGMKVHQQAMKLNHPERAPPVGPRPSSQQGKRSQKKHHDKMIQSLKCCKSQLQVVTETSSPEARFLSFANTRQPRHQQQGDKRRPSILSGFRDIFRSKVGNGAPEY